MFDPIITILIFIAVIAITAVLFGGWLIVAVIRLISRLLMAPFRASTEPESTLILPGDATATTIRCPNDRCRAENPATASFCRRCGSPVRTAVLPVQARRVAMW
ncbi:MAG: hypothetical protein M3478_16675 [Planctomycetota bacterium]|nr:hypothetical protein [Planctomycetota bacterium]